MIQKVREELMCGFEIVYDEPSSPYFKQEPKVIQAENSVIFDHLYELMTQHLCSLALGVNMVSNCVQMASDEEKSIYGIIQWKYCLK